MPFPLVVVDLSPAPAPPELVATLITACSDAVPDQSCVLAGEPLPAGEPRVVVQISWQQGYRQVEISIPIDVQGGRRVVRTLTFRDGDALAERWRAVGFAAGAMIEAEAPTRAPPRAAKAEAAPDKPPAAKAEPPPARGGDELPRSAPVWAGVGALTGPGLSSWRFGGWLRLDYAFEALPLCVGLAGSYAAAPEDEGGLNPSWLTLSTGAGVYLTIPAIRLDVRLRGELLLERLAVWAQDEATGLEDSGARWAVGPQLSVHATWPHDSVVAGVAGITAWTLSDETTVTMHGLEQATAPWGSLSLQLGLRLGLP